MRSIPPARSAPRTAAIRPADPNPRLPFAWSKRAVWILLFKKDDLDSDSNSLALLLCQRGPQAVLLPFGSPQLDAPSSHSSLTLPPPPPLGSAARCGAAEDALNPFGCNAQRRLAQSSRAPPRLNSFQGAHRLPARLPHASPQLGAGAAAAGVGGGWGAFGEDRSQFGYGRLQWLWD